VSGGLFGWIGEGVAEIGNQFNKVFTSDEAPGSNSGETQARTNRVSKSSNSGETHARSIDEYQRAGGASNGQSAWSQAFEFDPNTDDVNTKLKESGCKGKAGIYLIRDENDERTLYVGKAEATSTDILSRLRTHLTREGNSGIRERIEKGETLTIRWVECDNPEQYESVAMAYLLPADNERAEYLGAERTPIQEEMAIAILLDLPSFWHANYEEMVKEAKEQGLSVGGYGSNRVEVAEAIFWQCNEETKENYDDDRGSGGQEEGLLGGLISSFVALFGSSSDPESSVTSDNSKSDSENSSDSWFGNLFGDNSDSDLRDSSDYGSSNYGSGNYGDNDQSDYGSSNYGSSDYGSGDYGNSGDSDYGSNDYGSGDYGDSGDSDSSSSSSDSYGSDYGSSDGESGDDGDSGGSDNSSSSSDSWW
jgi:hypothetical protein